MRQNRPRRRCRIYYRSFISKGREEEEEEGEKERESEREKDGVAMVETCGEGGG